VEFTQAASKGGKGVRSHVIPCAEKGQEKTFDIFLITYNVLFPLARGTKHYAQKKVIKKTHRPFSDIFRRRV
jgi:hypothetical protein